jgi:hypothetical protein
MDKAGETISMRVETGTMAMLNDWVATAKPAVEHTGQMCVAEGPVVDSVQ